MLGLRLDQPLRLAEIEDVLDPAGLERVEELGLVRRDGQLLALTDRGRFLGDAVTAALLA
jgi:coproporphyrinogen III oxidase-like Fe-S oxidoreductase